MILTNRVFELENILALHYSYDEARFPNTPERRRVPVYEDKWFIRRGRTQIPVTREDYLRVLSNIDTILILASVDQNMDTASISRVNMDIAVPQVTGGPRACGGEECRCPPGYSGLSCEECSVGYYRNTDDTSRGPLGTCIKCPCNGNEQACSKALSGRVECTCRDGWGGAYCDTRGKCICSSIFYFGNICKNGISTYSFNNA